MYVCIHACMHAEYKYISSLYTRFSILSMLAAHVRMDTCLRTCQIQTHLIHVLQHPLRAGCAPRKDGHRSARSHRHRRGGSHFRCDGTAAASLLRLRGGDEGSGAPRAARPARHSALLARVFRRHHWGLVFGCLPRWPPAQARGHPAGQPPSQ